VRRSTARRLPAPPALLAALLVAVAAPVAAAEGAGAGSDCAARVAGAVQARYAEVEDLRARFRQETRSVALGGTGGGASASRGTVVFAKPGRMRWSYEAPEESLVVSDGEVLWLWDPKLGEAQRLPVGEAYLSAAAIQFLLGEGDLRQQFRVRALECGEEEATLELVPREDATYEKLRLTADPKTGFVQESVVFDLFGNETRVAFEDVRVNTDPPAELFTFEPPEDARVIELERAPEGAR